MFQNLYERQFKPTTLHSSSFLLRTIETKTFATVSHHDVNQFKISKLSGLAAFTDGSSAVHCINTKVTEKGKQNVQSIYIDNVRGIKSHFQKCDWSCVNSNDLYVLGFETRLCYGLNVETQQIIFNLNEHRHKSYTSHVRNIRTHPNDSNVIMISTSSSEVQLHDVRLPKEQSFVCCVKHDHPFSIPATIETEDKIEPFLRVTDALFVPEQPYYFISGTDRFSQISLWDMRTARLCESLEINVFQK